VFHTHLPRPPISALRAQISDRMRCPFLEGEYQWCHCGIGEKYISRFTVWSISSSAFFILVRLLTPNKWEKQRHFVVTNSRLYTVIGLRTVACSTIHTKARGYVAYVFYFFWKIRTYANVFYFSVRKQEQNTWMAVPSCKHEAHRQNPWRVLWRSASWELELEQGSEDAEAETDDTDSTPETE